MEIRRVSSMVERKEKEKKRKENARVSSTSSIFKVSLRCLIKRSRANRLERGLITRVSWKITRYKCVSRVTILFLDRSTDRSAQQKASSPPFPVYRGGVRGTRELGDVSNNWTRFNRGYLLYVLRVTNFLIMVTVI